MDECEPLAGGLQRLKRCGTCPAGGDPFGMAVQVDPMKPKLKLPLTKRLKLKCDILLSDSRLLLSNSTCAASPWRKLLLRGGVPARGLGVAAPRGVRRGAPGAAGFRNQLGPTPKNQRDPLNAKP